MLGTLDSCTAALVWRGRCASVHHTEWGAQGPGLQEEQPGSLGVSSQGCRPTTAVPTPALFGEAGSRAAHRGLGVRLEEHSIFPPRRQTKDLADLCRRTRWICRREAGRPDRPGRLQAGRTGIQLPDSERQQRCPGSKTKANSENTLRFPSLP